MATIEILDNEPDIFVEKDWIKVGKKYGYGLPFYMLAVQEAR
jgi:hypothetical protein